MDKPITAVENNTLSDKTHDKSGITWKTRGFEITNALKDRPINKVSVCCSYKVNKDRDLD